MKVATINFPFTFQNSEKNEQTMWEMVQTAVDGGAKCILLPELWFNGYDLENLSKYAEDTERLKSAFQTFSEQHDVTIVLGSLVERSDDSFFNRMYSYGPNGEECYRYDKTHLFRPMNEDQYFSWGNRISTFPVGDFSASGIICYDLRFAPWVSKARKQGANILFVSAQWPARRRDHWRTLLIARAIECGMYVVASNVCGSDDNNSFGGGSIIIDPWGEVLAEAGQSGEILYATLNRETVEDVRQRIPVWSDRREELY
ncbi:MAG: carbon-nitrogen family hydrolase [Bacilli bacterium]